MNEIYEETQMPFIISLESINEHGQSEAGRNRREIDDSISRFYMNSLHHQTQHSDPSHYFVAECPSVGIKRRHRFPRHHHEKENH